jgi:hypothetical protein
VFPQLQQQFWLLIWEFHFNQASLCWTRGITHAFKLWPCFCIFAQPTPYPSKLVVKNLYKQPVNSHNEPCFLSLHWCGRCEFLLLCLLPPCYCSVLNDNNEYSQDEACFPVGGHELHTHFTIEPVGVMSWSGCSCRGGRTCADFRLINNILPL